MVDSFGLVPQLNTAAVRTVLQKTDFIEDRVGIDHMCAVKEKADEKNTDWPRSP